MAPSKFRQEVLQLYREILRTARVFRGHSDAHQRDNCDTVCRSARTEIEKARNLTSSEEILRHLVAARAALQQVQEKVGRLDIVISFRTNTFLVLSLLSPFSCLTTSERPMSQNGSKYYQRTKTNIV